ncbi:hypothetical protein [Coraliomargarita parva]|uniref:hypothetical protein n=1 Tax=Coraliomargarita parva TaxID=3014050 RepID=UPI0022B5D8B3|nr:hypothetical protein [Coraliomargarita parva]
MKKAISALTILIVSVVRSAELPISIKALIPRHADITWQSTIERDEKEKISVFYCLPKLGRNDVAKYLEIFELEGDGAAKRLDRIYLGGRGACSIDEIKENGEAILIHVREHQGSDSISTPTKEAIITIRYRALPISISKTYTNE